MAGKIIEGVWKGVRIFLSAMLEFWLFIKPHSHYILIAILFFAFGYIYNDWKYGADKLQVAKERLEAVTAKAEYEAKKEQADSMCITFLRAIDNHAGSPLEDSVTEIPFRIRE